MVKNVRLCASAFSRVGSFLHNSRFRPQACGVLGNPAARQEQIDHIKNFILNEVIEDENLRQVLQGMDQEFRDDGREAPNWTRLFSGISGAQAEDVRRPIRLRDLTELERLRGGEHATVCKRFDLDTLSVVSKSLEVLKSIRLILRRTHASYRSEKEDLARGRLYIPRVHGDGGQGAFPTVKFKVEGLPPEEEALKTGYATKRFVGYPGGHMENKTFVIQLYCNLGGDVEKWAAWECCYMFLAACLCGDVCGVLGSAAPRSSSFSIPDPYVGGGRDWIQGIAVSSTEDCREYTRLFTNQEMQARFFASNFAKAVELVLNRHQRYVARLRPRQAREEDEEDEDNRMDENDEENMEDSDDNDEMELARALEDEVGQALEGDGELPGDDGGIIFDRQRCWGYFEGMMASLYFVTTIQFGRRGCGKIRQHLFPGRPEAMAQADDIAQNIVSVLREYIVMEEVVNTPTLLAPSIGMEVTVHSGDNNCCLGHQDEFFKVPSAQFHEDQSIRLHLDKRKFGRKKEQWRQRLAILERNVRAWKFKNWDAWGNMSKTDGPMGFKGKLGDQEVRDEGGEIDPLLELMLPVASDFGVQAPILCVYECTYRATSPYSIFQNEKRTLRPFKDMASRLSTKIRRQKGLNEVCDALVRMDHCFYVCGGAWLFLSLYAHKLTYECRDLL